ncbi:LPXTG cell wall anchor domain-containing protein, partial [Listeria monocytogenes]|nr:LPXTG cell wall anchor domain-containing protein [Listeria monocytogenes]
EINRNKIKEIPSEITTLSPHLGSLDVRYNELITLPDNIFTTEWESKLSLLTTGNQLVSDIPADWLDNFNQADNMLEFYNNPPNDYHQKQDQLTYSGARIEVPLNTDLKTLTPDKTKLGLKSGRTLFEQHEFMYYDDGTSNNILTNGVATATGNGYITIKSTLSTNSNPFAKVRVPITVTPPVKGGDVTVQYKDTTGVVLADSITLSGNVGENYTTTAKTIDGYSLTTTPTNSNGTFSTNPQTVTYTYKKDPIAQPVTVNYIDTDGKTIAPSETLTGNISENYTTTAKTIDGYSLTTTPANAKGTFSTEPQIINYIYAKNAETAQPITVNYRNSTGQKIAKSEVLTGNIGESYSTQPKTIAGYTLTTIPPNAKGTFTTNAQTVTYMYTPIAISALPVTVNYLDENGKEIADSVVLNGRVGEAYNTLAKEIDGYTLIKTPTNANGVFSAEAQSIDYIYRKNKPVVIVNPPIKNPIIKIDSSTNVIKEETSVLPKTGDSNPYNDFLAGILLLSSAMFLWKNHK